MFSIALIAGWICVAVWVYLLVGHGHFWRVSLPPALADRRPERGTQSIPDAAESKAPYTRQMGWAQGSFDCEESSLRELSSPLRMTELII